MTIDALEPAADPMQEKIMADVLRDWERLKKLENNLGALYAGRDLLAEIDAMKRDRDGWVKIAMNAQLKQQTPKKKQSRHKVTR